MRLGVGKSKSPKAAGPRPRALQSPGLTKSPRAAKSPAITITGATPEKGRAMAQVT